MTMMYYDDTVMRLLYKSCTNTAPICCRKKNTGKISSSAGMHVAAACYYQQRTLERGAAAITSSAV